MSIRRGLFPPLKHFKQCAPNEVPNGWVVSLHQSDKAPLCFIKREYRWWHYFYHLLTGNYSMKGLYKG